jgi:tRNA-dihydrouridine synthase B
LRHARKHLGWALDAAAATVRAPAERLKAHRESVLPLNDPRAVRHRLIAAFDEFSGPELAAA